jgi:hypothetical protein
LEEHKCSESYAKVGPYENENKLRLINFAGNIWVSESLTF